jgi:hypothetical protein
LGVGICALIGATTPAAPTTVAAPVRLLVIGDSTGTALGLGLAQWAKAHPSHIVVDRQAVSGCALVDANAQNMTIPAQWGRVPGACRNWAGRMAAQKAFRPDVVLFVFGPTQTSDLRPGSSSTATNITRNDFQWLSIAQAALLRKTFPSAVFLWTSAPQTFYASTAVPENRWLFNNPARIAAWNSLLLAMSKWPLSARIHLAAFVGTAPGGLRDRSWRPDGVHLAGTGLAKTAAWVAALVVADYRYFRH